MGKIKRVRGVRGVRKRQKGGAIFTISFLISCLVMAARVGMMAARAARIGMTAVRAVKTASKVVKAVKGVSKAVKWGKRAMDATDAIDDAVGAISTHVKVKESKSTPGKDWTAFHKQLAKRRDEMIRQKRDRTYAFLSRQKKKK